MTPARRWSVGATALAAVLAGGALGWMTLRKVSDAPRPVATTAAEPAATGGEFVAGKLAGRVEVRAGGDWQPLRDGERLGADALLRTGAGSSVVLRAASGAEVALGDNVAIGVVEVSATLAAFRLDQGRVEAKTGTRGQELEFRRDDAKAKSSDGRFVVMSTARGMLAVAVRTGQVRLVAAGAEVRVEQGQQAHVQPGAAPSDPVAIPADVFLQVRWPDETVAKGDAAVDGRVDPSTKVTVNGAPAAVDGAGTFTAKVPVGLGRTKVAVVAEDVLGRKRELGGAIVRRSEPTAPRLSADAADLWGKPPKPPRKKGTSQ